MGLTKIIDKNGYTFNASAGVITLTPSANLTQEGLLVITNVKKGNNIIIYNFGCPGFGGTVNINNYTINLEYDTSAMSDTDDLQIILNVKEEDTENTRLLKAIEINSDLAREIITQLKINNLHQSLITGSEFDETNID